MSNALKTRLRRAWRADGNEVQFHDASVTRKISVLCLRPYVNHKSPVQSQRRFASSVQQIRSTVSDSIQAKHWSATVILEEISCRSFLTENEKQNHRQTARAKVYSLLCASRSGCRKMAKNCFSAIGSNLLTVPKIKANGQMQRL